MTNRMGEKLMVKNYKIFGKSSAITALNLENRYNSFAKYSAIDESTEDFNFAKRLGLL